MDAPSAPGILVVTLDFPPRVGGIQILVHRLVLNFPTHAVRVVAPTSPGAGSFDATLGLPVIRVPLDPSNGRVYKLLTLLWMLGRSVLEAWRTRPRVVLCSHVIVAPIGWVVRTLFGIPYVVYVHGDELLRLSGVRALVLRAADRAIADSRYSRDLAVRVGAARERISVIGQGADPLPAPPGLAPNLGTRVPTVLCVARMDELYKGQDVLIRSVPLIKARVSDVRLTLVGDGPYRSYYQRLADSLGVADRVIFTGRVADEERDQWLDTCDVFAMPSRANALDGAGEGFGVVYVEAGAHGKPVMAGQVGGSLDSVVDGVTGLLVDPESVHEVADALLRLLTDPGLAARLGESGRQRVATELSWPQIGRRVEAVLLDAASRPRATRG